MSGDSVNEALVFLFMKCWYLRIKIRDLEVKYSVGSKQYSASSSQRGGRQISLMPILIGFQNHHHLIHRNYFNSRLKKSKIFFFKKKRLNFDDA
jgi:hypothetical protein